MADSSEPFGGVGPDNAVFRPKNESRDDDRGKRRKRIRSSGPAWYESWWFWTIIGGVVVTGGVTGLTIWLMQPEESWTLVIQPSP